MPNKRKPQPFSLIDDYLRRLVIASNRTQRDLAGETNCSVSYFNTWLHSDTHMSAYKLYKLARALGYVLKVYNV